MLAGNTAWERQEIATSLAAVSSLDGYPLTSSMSPEWHVSSVVGEIRPFETVLVFKLGVHVSQDGQYS